MVTAMSLPTFLDGLVSSPTCWVPTISLSYVYKFNPDVHMRCIWFLSKIGCDKIFNLICRSCDKNNDRINGSMMNRFKSALDKMELKEIHLHGRKHVVEWNRWPHAFLKLIIFSALGNRNSRINSTTTCKHRLPKPHATVPCCSPAHLFIGISLVSAVNPIG